MCACAQDKFERANYNLEAFIATANLDVDDRTVAHLLSLPIEDGGQFSMIASLIKKYGLVPKVAMPETESSGNSRLMNTVLARLVRQGAYTLRRCLSSGGTVEEARRLKGEILRDIWRVLCIHLGTPPLTINWQWEDSERKFHRVGPIDPHEFRTQFTSFAVDDYVCLVNDPRSTSPYNRSFTVKFLGNVVGGDLVKYLNVDIATMKRAAQRMLEASAALRHPASCTDPRPLFMRDTRPCACAQDGEPVWFGCDCGKDMRRELGLLDTRIYEASRRATAAAPARDLIRGMDRRSLSTA